jgi:hypothetical protein
MNEGLMFLIRLSKLLCVVLALAASGYAQYQSGPLHLQGSVNFSGEVYAADGISNRRPGNSYRAVLTPTIVLFDQIQLPFEVFIGSEGKGYRQPFNQFGVNPRLFGWLTLHAGYYSAMLSELTFGDTRLLGGGIEANPGIVRFAFLYGRSQRAIAPDSANGVYGAYERWIAAVKLGIGRESSYYIHLNVMHASDDSASIQNPPPSVTPKENVVASLKFGLPLTPFLTINGEAAISALSNDTKAAERSGVPSWIRWLFISRSSSQFDGAGSISMNIVPTSMLSLQLTGKWIGPGFVTLGYAQMPNDVLEATIGPSVRLLEGKLNLQGTFGRRWNNLRNNRFSTTQRTIGTLHISSQPGEHFGIDASYTNYGMRSSINNDTLRIDNITQSLTISPRILFTSFGGPNTLVFSYSFSDFSDFNTVTAATGQNQTHVANLTWSLAFPSALAFSTSLMYTSSATSFATTTIKSVMETMNYPLLDNKLTTSLTIGYNIIGASSSNDQISARLSVAYSSTGTVTLNLMSNAYNLGSGAAASPAYSEFQAGLQYSLSF